MKVSALEDQDLAKLGYQYLATNHMISQEVLQRLADFPTKTSELRGKIADLSQSHKNLKASSAKSISEKEKAEKKVAELQKASDRLKAEYEESLLRSSAEVERLKRDLAEATEQNSKLIKGRSELQKVVDSIPQQISDALVDRMSSAISEYKRSTDFIGALNALFVPVLCSGFVQGVTESKDLFPDLDPSKLLSSHLYDESMEVAFSTRLEEFQSGIDIGLKYNIPSDPAL